MGRAGHTTWLSKHKWLSWWQTFVLSAWWGESLSIEIEFKLDVRYIDECCMVQRQSDSIDTHLRKHRGLPGRAPVPLVLL